MVHAKRTTTDAHAAICGMLRNVFSTTVQEAICADKSACNQCVADYWVPVVKTRFPELDLWGFEICLQSCCVRHMA